MSPAVLEVKKEDYRKNVLSELCAKLLKIVDFSQVLLSSDTNGVWDVPEVKQC